jgi:virginiamycin B lyase
MSGAYSDVAPVPWPGALWSVTLGADGNLWAVGDVGGSRNNVARISTSGSATLFPLPSGATESGAHQIIVGPDGNLWATETSQKKIARITTGGFITEFPAGPGFPTGLTVGPDGAIWFTDQLSGIKRMTTAGVITLTIPTSVVDGICTGPDGNIWFGLFDPPSVGRLMADGGITTYAIPSGYRAYALVAGPDGNVWFAGGPSVGKVDLAVVRLIDQARDVGALFTFAKVLVVVGIAGVASRLLRGAL